MRIIWIISLVGVLLTLPNMAYAGCTSWIIQQDGKTVYCVQCCQMGNCTLNCT